MYRRIIHITRDAILRVVQPPFVVGSLVGGISFKIFQIPELEEVIANRALTFMNHASYIQDGRTATLQMLHFIYIFFNKYKY